MNSAVPATAVPGRARAASCAIAAASAITEPRPKGDASLTTPRDSVPTMLSSKTVHHVATLSTSLKEAP
jgi:hypothetical protein